MKTRIHICLLILLALPSLLFAQKIQTATYLGYAYPSGGCVGEQFEVILGGRYLTKPQEIFINGEGISVEILQHYRALRKINGSRRTMLKMRIAEREKTLTEKPIPPYIQKAFSKISEADLEKDKMPPSTTFDGIETMELVEIRNLTKILNEYNDRQFNAQIGEEIKIRVTINKNATPGIREMRILSQAGLSNPIRFQVSSIPEQLEQEPNDATSSYSSTSIIGATPTVVNGQIMPGDIDRYLIRITEKQDLAFDLMARRLIPYVADAVPGWFQATLALYDGEGRRLAYVDDTYGDPDPKLRYRFTQPGNYILEVRDAIYRGRENFVYRMHIANEFNIQNTLRHLDVDYSQETLPYLEESVTDEPKNAATPIALPQVIIGQVNPAKEVDHYTFEGSKGDSIIAKVEARHFGSPLDSILRILGPKGQMLKYNDDHIEKRAHLHTGPGSMTHYADSYLTYTLEESGTYTLTVEDAQRSGGEDYKYRLRVSQPIPDFEARITPSSLNIGATGCASFKIHINRLDGFTEPIQLELIDPPEGARLHNARIAEGESESWATLQWPKSKRYTVNEIQMRATARVNNGQSMQHLVVPTDNSMQAFLWRHLLPAQQLQVATMVSYQPFTFADIIETTAITLSKANECEYVIPLTKKLPEKAIKRYQLQIKEAPEGVELTDSRIEDTRIVLQFKCNEALAKTASRGNLIVEIIDIQTNPKKKKPQNRPIGVLPAIPYQISAQ